MINIENWFREHHVTFTNLPTLSSWDLKSLPPFKQLLDIEKAADIILQNLESNSLIGIFGDYDVDGTTSCALFYHFFTQLKLPHTPLIKCYQPGRFKEGYGLHVHSVELAKSENVSLLITVDCGITSIEAAKRAQELHLDLIISDHHQDAAPEMPIVNALVNPNRRDQTYQTAEAEQLRCLAGVGVAFAICVIVREKLIQKNYSCDSLYKLLPFYALGTISDLATLNSMNLRLVRHGLKLLTETTYPGLVALLDGKEFSKKYLDSDLIGFHLGPLLNAKGRMDHPELALELLTTLDPERAKNLAYHLFEVNQKRKETQIKILNEAKIELTRELNLSGEKTLPIAIAYNPKWHEGVIGIVAAKLVDFFQCPALVFTKTEDGNFIKASARTFKNLDLFELLKTTEDLFEKFGGHRAAAGMTMKEENLFELKTRLKSKVLEQARIADLSPKVEDKIPYLQIPFSEINEALLENIYQHGPYGQGHPMPLLKIQQCKIIKYSILKDEHVKWTIMDTNPTNQTVLNALSFYYFSKNQVLHPEELVRSQANFSISLIGHLKVNTFRKKDFMQFLINDLRINPKL